MTLSSLPLHDTPKPSAPAAQDTYPRTSLVCLFGVFLYIILSPPLLQTIGLNYNGEGGSPFEKLHPGTFFIVLSFMMLLLHAGNPISAIGKLFVEQTVYTGFLLLCLLILTYMSWRSGAKGLSFFIDTHISTVLCAIILSYAPVKYCRKSIHFFVAMATLNSLIGIMEGIGKFHVLAVPKGEDLFRATALLGHPLENAMFTSFALFISIALPLSSKLKCLLVIIYITSLVAFGGRAGLLYALTGVAWFGLAYLFRVLRAKQLSIMQVIMLVGGLLLIPALFVGGLDMLLNSSMGERLMSTGNFSDDSANSRLLDFQTFNYMTREDVIFGVSTEKILDIAYRMNLQIPHADIENPWILMIMYMGIVVFPIWLIGTGIFVWRLMKDNPLALRLAVLGYYITASTSNSFGRKDSMYPIMVSVILCASRYLWEVANEKRGLT